MTLIIPHIATLTPNELRTLRLQQTSPKAPYWLVVLDDGSVILEAAHGQVDWRRRDAPDVRFYLYVLETDDLSPPEYDDEDSLNRDVIDAQYWWSEGVRGHVD